jgi:hypothetical protein
LCGIRRQKYIFKRIISKEIFFSFDNLKFANFTAESKLLEKLFSLARGTNCSCSVDKMQIQTSKQAALERTKAVLKESELEII